MKTQRLLQGKTILISALSIILIALPSYAKKAPDLAIDELDTLHWQAVSEEKLATLRGGFVLGNGVVVDLNFQKHLFQNGELVGHSYFQTPQDFTQLGKDELSLSSVLPNNTFNTVLQNTLDNQTLSAITNIDITIKNIEHAKQAFAQDQLYNTYFNARAHH
ncbi:hypothetical protein FX988_00761 [Paraglaciecola mesophila]|uniref:Uncharacterized protein n=1 Tax=Paraglaciecola mesophila TaxID=197222 RepID=A0A857JHY5_9ALTE|nr:hypothetical protein [Paraglaciecola mesophila]QHJ10547.1 hypothetical protein FX988_00761 [Paraglaciecola mesophila]